MGSEFSRGRRAGCGAFLAGAVLALALTAPPMAAAGGTGPMGPDAWPMYGLNARHDANYAREGGAAGAAVAWSFAVPGAIPPDAGVASVRKEYVSPTAVRDLVGIPVGVSIAGGILYVPDDDGHLYALRAADGKLIWKFDAHNQIMTTPVVGLTPRGKMVYVGGGNSDFTYSEAARFAQPGARVVRGSGISGIYALDAASGRRIWTFHTRGEDMPTPALIDGTLVFGNGDGHIYGLDAASGRLKWRIEIGSFVSMASATVAGDLVIMAGTHPDKLFAVDERSGTLAWATPLPAWSSSAGDCAPAAADGIVVTEIEAKTAVPGEVESDAVAVDAKSGERLWTTGLGLGEVPPRNKDAVPMIHDGVVYTGSPVTETAYALSLKDGTILWRRRLARMKAAPAIDGKNLFFPLADGTIAVLEKATGDVVNRYRVSRGGFGPQNAVIVDRTLFIGSNFGRMYAIPVSDVVSEAGATQRAGRR